jgi:hypothetical protein
VRPHYIVHPGSETGANTAGGCFGIGSKPQQMTWVPDGNCAFHVSIGEAF